MENEDPRFEALVDEYVRTGKMPALDNLDQPSRDEAESLLHVAEMIWELGSGAPALEADPVAAELGLVPDPNRALDSRALKAAMAKAGLRASDVATSAQESRMGSRDPRRFRVDIERRPGRSTRHGPRDRGDSQHVSSAAHERTPTDLPRGSPSRTRADSGIRVTRPAMGTHPAVKPGGCACHARRACARCRQPGRPPGPGPDARLVGRGGFPQRDEPA